MDYSQQSGEKIRIDFRKLDAYLKYYMHIHNPEMLSDDQWAEEVQNLHYIRTTEREASNNIA